VRICNGYGQTPSKWFSRFKISRGIADKGKVFHSFRHTVVNHLKDAGVARERIAELVGHEDESVTFGVYGSRFNPASMMEVVSLLDFTAATRNLEPFKCRSFDLI
jgi:integrase